MLGPAAAVEQLSPHVLAAAVVREARRRGLDLPLPERIVEEPGRGVEGTVGGVRVAAGSADWLRRRGCDLADGPPAPSSADGHATVLVALDGRLAGAVAMADAVRPDAPALVERLRRAGVEEIAVVTGDDPATAAAVAARVGVADVHAGQTPESKLALVVALRGRPGGGTVVMVGDGVNDAPRWRPPTWASRWGPEGRRRRPRPPTPSSSTTASTGSPRRWRSGAGPSGSPARA